MNSNQVKDLVTLHSISNNNNCNNQNFSLNSDGIFKNGNNNFNFQVSNNITIFANTTSPKFSSNINNKDKTKEEENEQQFNEQNAKKMYKFSSNIFDERNK